MSAGVRYHRTLAARQTSHLIQSEESPAGHREHEYVLKHLMYIKVEIEVDEMDSQVGVRWSPRALAYGDVELCAAKMLDARHEER